MGIKGRLMKGVNLQRTLKEAPIGETVYISCSALVFDEDEIPYLDVGHSYDRKPMGTSQLPVTRTGEGEADYDIDITNIHDYQWELLRNPFEGIMGVDHSKIVQLSYDDEKGDIRDPEDGPRKVLAFKRRR